MKGQLRPAFSSFCTPPSGQTFEQLLGACVTTFRQFFAAASRRRRLHTKKCSHRPPDGVRPAAHGNAWTRPVARFCYRFATIRL
jgi:hypothetical protein